ncbi:hypothetical protein AAL_00217 [Moelleriella libera RCEF 2490]|uniref:DUF7924 domain-containing protein n=1 Tax=Moelleriella libera RCEF 2490 TaxID=1081109 RepID=A0A166UNH9_9HYPO|nr:hypothetical protein AAL_00217 [Moelleriella libera RCEF 2490]
MALPQERKRERADGSLPTHFPSKKTKAAPSRGGVWKRQAEDSEEHNRSQKLRSSDTEHRSHNFPPEFYENLSKVWLTPRALRELERQYIGLPPSKSAAGVGSRRAKLSALAKFGVHELALFATAGGPDLSDLRGCPAPTSITHPMASPSVSSSVSQRTKSTKPTTVSTRRSTAYDANFRQHCRDHHIFPPFYKFPDGRRPPKPGNLNEIRQALKVPWRSLSPSVASEAAFEDFQYKNTTRSEGTIMRNIIPLIAGDADIPNEGHLPFTNLASITEDTTVNPNPDFFDGAHPEAVDQEVREALNSTIIPTKRADTPIAPNLFLEAKSFGGSLDVAEAQVILDGAYGTMAMHSLQNHLLDTPMYDGNAYTFTATFLGGLLSLYAHHLTAPAAPGQTPGCHMTQLKAFALTGDHEVWVEGIAAFRNMRKLAKEYRDQFIETANTRSRKQRTEVAADIGEDDAASTAKDEDNEDVTEVSTGFAKLSI